MMYYVAIENHAAGTYTKRDYKTEKGAERAYNKAIENPDNYVQMVQYATGYELFDTVIKSNWA